MSDSQTSAEAQAEREDTLFIVLCRPPLFLGVPLIWCLGNILLVIPAGAWLGKLFGYGLAWWVVLIPAAHGVMRLAMARDFYMGNLLAVWFRTKAQAALGDKQKFGGWTLTPIPHGLPDSAKRMSISV